jgi:hypothetical protein
MGEKAKTPLYSRQPITAWYRPRAWGCTAGEESDAVRGSEPAADDPEDTRRSIASCVYNRGGARQQRRSVVVAKKRMGAVRSWQSERKS